MIQATPLVSWTKTRTEAEEVIACKTTASNITRHLIESGIYCRRGARRCQPAILTDFDSAPCSFNSGPDKRLFSTPPLKHPRKRGCLHRSFWAIFPSVRWQYPDSLVAPGRFLIPPPECARPRAQQYPLADHRRNTAAHLADRSLLRLGTGALRPCLTLRWQCRDAPVAPRAIK